MRFHVHHSHLYPGARLSALTHDAPATGVAVIEFSDGAGTTGTASLASPSVIELHVAAYRTVAGTQIPAKRWALAPTAERGIWQVVGKLPGAE